MKEFQEKRNIRKWIFSKYTFIVLGGISGFLIYSTFKVYLTKREARQANQKIYQEIEDLRSRKKNLEVSMRKLQTQAGIEEEIRGKFPVRKPGEEIVVIIDEKFQINNSDTEQNGGFLENLWIILKSIF